MSKPTVKPMRILVVDDNRDAATTLGFLLAASGYKVETSFDAREALATAETAMILTARGAEQHSSGTRPPRPSSIWPWHLVCPAS